MNNNKKALALALALVAGIATPAQAATVSWQFATVGNWQDPVVWYSTNDVANMFRTPTASDLVFIDSRTGSGTTVSITSGTANAQVIALDALLTLRGGTLNTLGTLVGNGYGTALARMYHSGGTHNVGALVVGNAEGSTGRYEISDSAVLNAGKLTIGDAGKGSFYQFGGNTVINSSRVNSIGLVLGNDEESCRQKPTSQCYGDILNISPSWYSSGLYDLRGGSLKVYGDVAVGLYGEGVFKQSGGTHTILRSGLGTGNLNIGGMASTYASGRVASSYTLSGSSSILDVAGETRVGVAASGSFNQNGGVHKTVSLLVGDGMSGQYILNSGALDTGSTRIATGGQTVSGTFTQNGGSHHVAGRLVVGDSRYGVGSYVMTGGTLDVSSNYIPDGINSSNSGTTVGETGYGQFIQSGGTHIAGQLIVGSYIAGASGVYALSGTGALVAGSIGHGNGMQAVTPGSFKFNGGRLSVITFHGDLLNNGGTLAPTSFAGTLTANAMPGSTHITGNYQQAAAGKMLIELGGTSGGLYDSVTVDGIATLDGALSVVFIDGFHASAGDSFVVLSANSLVGQFNAVGLASLAPDLIWTMSYNLNPKGTDTLSLMVTSTLPVPEAETWAMLLAGLGLVGAATRRRRG